MTANPLAHPKFKGDRKKLVSLVDGKLGVEVPDKLIPACFSDPNLESGICNPLLPLKKGEPHLCALHKSCLIAKLLSRSIQFPFMEARNKSYEEILSEADQLFDCPPEEDPSIADTERQDRQSLRAQVLSVPLEPPFNPFRRNSLRRFLLEILSQDWISMRDLRAILMSKKEGIRRFDLVIGQVTSLGTQEHHGYRIVESAGKYKAFRR